MVHDAQLREIAPAPGSTLHYVTLFLPEARRRGILAVTAFAREMTAIARERKDADIARTKLAWWRSELASLFEGRPRHPLAIAMAEFTGEVARSAMEDIVTGAEMDLDYNAYPDWAALDVYCRRGGGGLARLWAEVCGFSEPDTLEAARDLGSAFELARIVRDTGIDARRDRIYLPLHELAEYGVTAEDLIHARETEPFRKLMAFQVERAERLHREALARFPASDRKAQRPLIVKAAINRALLAEIREDGYRVLTRRTALTPLRKLWLAWRAPL